MSVIRMTPLSVPILEKQRPSRSEFSRSRSTQRFREQFLLRSEVLRPLIQNHPFSTNHGQERRMNATSLHRQHCCLICGADTNLGGNMRPPDFPGRGESMSSLLGRHDDCSTLSVLPLPSLCLRCRLPFASKFDSGTNLLRFCDECLI